MSWSAQKAKRVPVFGNELATEIRLGMKPNIKLQLVYAKQEVNGLKSLQSNEVETLVANTIRSLEILRSLIQRPRNTSLLP
ncbi:hypothetical protein V2J09_021238 [Rumex salicifolius]